MKPAETQVLDEVEARLNNITVANGYPLTVRSVERGKLTPFKAGDIPAINFWPTRHSREDTTYSLDKHTLRVMVDMRDASHAKEDGTFPDIAAEMIAVIVTALKRTTAAPLLADAADECFSDTVTSVTMSDSGYQIGEGQKPWVGALVEVEIVYDSESGDMFNYQP